MLSDADRHGIRSTIRTGQIVVGALALGVLNFTAVVLFISLGSQQGHADPPVITYAATGFAALAAIASFGIPLVLVGPMRQTAVSNEAAGDGTPGRARALANMYLTMTIIRCAILEGAAFFCLISYMLERNPTSMVVGSVLFVLLLLQLPTSSRVGDRIESDLMNAQQVRQFE
jgi:hypothetical protein